MLTIADTVLVDRSTRPENPIENFYKHVSLNIIPSVLACLDVMSHILA